MKHLIAALYTAATVASCYTPLNVSDASALAGEWEITAIEGRAVNPAESEETPFLGFDTKSKNLYGSAGCNSLTGTYSTRKGAINLSQVGCTRMLCANMETERRVLDALSKVQGFTISPDSILTLSGNGGTNVMTLKKKAK